MKKLILILSCCCLLPVCAQAQCFYELGKIFCKSGNSAMPAAEKATNTAIRNASKAAAKNTTRSATKNNFNRKLTDRPKTTSTVLEKRNKKEKQDALKISRKVLMNPNVNVPIGNPVELVSMDPEGLETLKKLSFPEDINPGKAGSQVEEKNLINYTAMRNNRLYNRFAQSIIDREKRVPEIKEQVKLQTGSIGTPKNSTAWLATQVPETTNVLLVGEGYYHNPAVAEAVGDFLSDLRRQAPKRKIILLTDYLEQDVVWKPNQTHRPLRNPIWQKVADSDIEIIGVENPKFDVMEIDLHGGIDARGLDKRTFWMDSLEVLDIRAKEIAQRVHHMLTKNPDALVVVHVKQDQAAYNLPIVSLANKLKTKVPNLYVTNIASKTTVRHDDLFPDYGFEDISTRTTLIEQMYYRITLPDQGAVSPALAKDLGVDAWIKIPYDVNKHDIGGY